jgi:hypothetical protein
MLRRGHLVIGITAIVAFVLSGQLLGHHRPAMEQLPAEMRMMYISRHIYLLTGALVNAVLGLYLRLQPSGWRRTLQVIGSIFILTSVFSLSMAFLTEPPLGLAGRGWRSLLGLISLFAGVILHLIASIGVRRIDTTP